VVTSVLAKLRQHALVRSAAYAGVVTTLVAVTEAGKKWT
jgi:hypothetical protein